MAKNAPSCKKKVGSVEITQWQGEFQGKPTQSYNIKKQKYNKETKVWEDSPFLTITDLKDIMVACQMMLMDVYGQKSTSTDDVPFA